MERREGWRKGKEKRRGSLTWWGKVSHLPGYFSVSPRCSCIALPWSSCSYEDEPPSLPGLPKRKGEGQKDKSKQGERKMPVNWWKLLSYKIKQEVEIACITCDPLWENRPYRKKQKKIDFFILNRRRQHHRCCSVALYSRQRHHWWYTHLHNHPLSFILNVNFSR